MKFITFGCWGKRTEDGEGPILKVLKTLKTYLREVDFIMVTGDNYYPEGKYFQEDVKVVSGVSISQEGGEKVGKKKKEAKKLNIDNHKNNIESLKNIASTHGVHLYMCTGNHEYKPHITEGKTILPVTLQKELLGKEDYFENGGIFRDDDNSIFYTINTESSNGCPIPHELYSRKLYVFGHIPILSLKYKTKKSSTTYWSLESNVLRCFRNIGGRHVTYLCADTHNYQDMTITLNGGGTIRQVVVGTGGTFPLDDIECSGETRLACVGELRKKMLGSDIQRVDLNYAETGNHGFCVFDTSSDTAEFVRVDRDTEISAGSPIAEVVAGSPTTNESSPTAGSPKKSSQTAAGLHKKRHKRRSRKTRNRVTYKRRRMNRKKSKKSKKSGKTRRKLR